MSKQTNLIEILDRLPVHRQLGWDEGERFYGVAFIEPLSGDKYRSLQESFGYGQTWDQKGISTGTPIVSPDRLYIPVGYLAK